MTDGLPAYKHIGKTQQHLAVDHSGREYARTDAASGHRVHVNRVESLNAFMRSAVIGVFHNVSVKHLGRYTGAQHSIRWEGFHRRPEIDQSLLRWGTDEIGLDVMSDSSTRCGACYVNLIVSKERIESGQYASVSDYVCDLILRDQVEDLQAIIAALIEGEKSGVSPRKVPDTLEALLKEVAGKPE